MIGKVILLEFVVVMIIQGRLSFCFSKTRCHGFLKQGDTDINHPGQHQYAQTHLWYEYVYYKKEGVFQRIQLPGLGETHW